MLSNNAHTQKIHNLLKSSDVFGLAAVATSEVVKLITNKNFKTLSVYNRTWVTSHKYSSALVVV